MHSPSRRSALALIGGGLAVAAAAPALGRSAVAADMPPQQPLEDPLAAMVHDGSFSQWLDLIVMAGLSYNFEHPRGPFTAFFPTNEALAPYPYVVRQVLGETNGRADEAPIPDTTRMVTIVRAHIIKGLHPISEFAGKKAAFTSLVGTPLDIDGANPSRPSITWNFPRGNGHATANVSGPPLTAYNALIYPVDKLDIDASY